MKNRYIISPIGVRPFWLHTIERNKDLADAILRYSDFENCHTKDSLEYVRRWALEIVRNCERIEILEHKEENWR
jgi:hypothetical protein